MAFVKNSVFHRHSKYHHEIVKLLGYWSCVYVISLFQLNFHARKSHLLTRDASAERGDATVSRLSVCLSVTFRYRVQIRWNSSEITSRPNSLRSMRSLTPNTGDLVQREHPKIRVEYGCGQMKLIQDATLSLRWPRDALNIWLPWKLCVSTKSADDCTRISTLQSYHYSAVKLFSKYSNKCDHGT